MHYRTAKWLSLILGNYSGQKFGLTLKLNLSGWLSVKRFCISLKVALRRRQNSSVYAVIMNRDQLRGLFSSNRPTCESPLPIGNFILLKLYQLPLWSSVHDWLFQSKLKLLLTAYFLLWLRPPTTVEPPYLLHPHQSNPSPWLFLTVHFTLLCIDNGTHSWWYK